MKRTALILVFFVFLTAINGFCLGRQELRVAVRMQGENDGSGVLTARIEKTEKDVADIWNELKKKPPVDPEQGAILTGQRVPVSPEIISLMKDNDLDIDAVPYYLSSSITLNMNNLARKLVSNEQKTGIIEINESSFDSIEISGNEPGKMMNSSAPGRSGREVFDVFYEGKNITLRFARNNRINRFELVSYNRDGTNYAFNFGKVRPFLNVEYSYRTNGGSIQLQGVVNNRTDPDINRERSYNMIPAHNSSMFQPSTSISGRGSLNEDDIDDITAYIRSQYHGANSRDSRELIAAYFREARLENINPDIAIAQMLYATNYLSNDRMRTHNYAGLSTEGTRSRDWTGPRIGSFLNRSDGVRAHIQHLKGYTTTSRPSRPWVDPRYDMLGRLKGHIQDFDQLYLTWMPYSSRDYKRSIERILNDLYEYSGIRRI